MAKNEWNYIEFTIDRRDEKKIFHDDLTFVCPISGELFVDPVFCLGYTFERNQISKWFETHDSHPMTPKKLRNEERVLFENYSIKSSTNLFRDEISKSCNIEIERFLALFNESEVEGRYNQVGFNTVRLLEKLFERSFDVRPNNTRTIENAANYFPLIEKLTSFLSIERKNMIKASRSGLFVPELSVEDMKEMCYRFEEEKKLLSTLFRKQKERRSTNDILNYSLDSRLTNVPFFYSLLLGSTENEVVKYELARKVYLENFRDDHTCKYRNELLTLLHPEMKNERDQFFDFVHVRSLNEEKMNEFQAARDRFILVTKYLLGFLCCIDRERYDSKMGMEFLRNALANDHLFVEASLKSFDMITEYVSLVMSIKFNIGLSLMKESKVECAEYFEDFGRYVKYVSSHDRFKDFLRNKIGLFFEKCYYMETTHTFDEEACNKMNTEVIKMFQSFHTSEGLGFVEEEYDQVESTVSLEEFSSLKEEKLALMMKTKRDVVGKKFYAEIHGIRFPNDMRNMSFYSSKPPQDNYESFSNFFKHTKELSLDESKFE